MKKIVFCTSFYESGRKYLHDYFRGIIDAQNKIEKKITLNIIIDDFIRPEESLHKYKKIIDINIKYIDKKATITEIRNQMIKNAFKLSSDMLIFTDMDDIVSHNAIKTHSEALMNFDISYGDMKVVSEKSQYLNYNLYQNIKIPDSINKVESLLEGNFLGLSNTAINTTALKNNFKYVPSHLKATDWWLFTMLIYKGLKAKKTKEIVGYYRQHDQNVLGYKKLLTLSILINKCIMDEEHFASLPNTVKFKKALLQVQTVKKLAIKFPNLIEKRILKLNNKPSIWFGEIFDIYKNIEK